MHEQRGFPAQRKTPVPAQASKPDQRLTAPAYAVKEIQVYFTRDPKSHMWITPTPNNPITAAIRGPSA